MRSPFVIPSSGQNGLSRFEKRSSRRPRLISGGSGTRSGARRRQSCPHEVGDTRARAAVLRASTRRTRPRRRARARPRDVGAADPRHLRNLGERRVGALERREQGAQTLDLGVGEARADVARPAQPTRVLHPDDERAEPSGSAALTARVPGDRRPPASGAASPSASRASGGRAGTASPLCFATTPSSSCSRAAARSAWPSSNCGETSTSCARARRAARAACGAPRVARRRAARTRARGGRRARGRTCRRPPGGARSASGRCSSSAQISPSSTASDERIASAAARATSRNRCVRSFPFRLVNVTSPPDDRHDRAEAVPLRLVDPALARGEHIGRRGEHGLVRSLRVRAAVLAQQQPVLRVAVERGRHERPHAVEPLAVQPDGQPAVALLLEELVRPAIPDLDRAGAVLARPGSCPRSPRTRADGPRRAPRDAARRAGAGRPSAPPSSRARRRARAGSRSGGAARRVAG